MSSDPNERFFMEIFPWRHQFSVRLHIVPAPIPADTVCGAPTRHLLRGALLRGALPPRRPARVPSGERSRRLCGCPSWCCSPTCFSTRSLARRGGGSPPTPSSTCYPPCSSPRRQPSWSGQCTSCQSRTVSCSWFDVAVCMTGETFRLQLGAMGVRAPGAHRRFATESHR